MSILRPSAAPMWSVCPGYVRMQRPEFDDAGDTTVREEGTACHFAAQQLAEGKPIPAVAPNGVEIDDDMRDAAQEYVQRCRESMGDSVRIEQRVLCHGVHPRCEGTPDAATAFATHSAEMWVTDLKYGFRLVESDSAQLVCYVDGVARKYGVNLADGYSWVNIAVFQPRAYHPDGPWRVRRVPGPQMLQEIAELSAKAHATDAPGAPCVVNAACGDCSGRFDCEALRNAALHAVERVGRSVPMNMPLAAREAELRYVEHAAKLLDAYVSGQRMVVEHALRAGARGTHYQIAAGKPGNLKWNEGSQEKVQRFAALAGWDVMQPPKLRTPTQLKKLLGDAVIEAHASRSPGAVKLQPIDLTKYSKLLGKY